MWLWRLKWFFARDDIDTTIIQYLGNPKSTDLIPRTNIPRDKKINTSYYKDCHNAPLVNLDNDGSNNINFTYESGKINADSKDSFPSADQISNLLVGFAFVKKIVVNNESYNGEKLSDLAARYTSLIMNYFSRVRADQTYFPGEFWDIKLPYNEMVLKHGGYEFTVMGYPLAKAGEAITMGDWSNIGPLYKGQWSGTAAQASLDAWNCSNFPKGMLMYRQRNDGGGAIFTNAILSQLAAIGNSWEYGLIPIKEKEFCVALPCLPIKFDNCTRTRKICAPRPFGGCTQFNICFPTISSWNCDMSYCAYSCTTSCKLPHVWKVLLTTAMKR